MDPFQIVYFPMAGACLFHLCSSRNCLSLFSIGTLILSFFFSLSLYISMYILLLYHILHILSISLVYLVFFCSQLDFLRCVRRRDNFLKRAFFFSFFNTIYPHNMHQSIILIFVHLILQQPSSTVFKKIIIKNESNEERS